MLTSPDAIADTKMLIGADFVAGTEDAETVLAPKTGATILELPEASAAHIGVKRVDQDD